MLLPSSQKFHMFAHHPSRTPTLNLPNFRPNIFTWANGLCYFFFSDSILVRTFRKGGFRERVKVCEGVKNRQF